MAVILCIYLLITYDYDYLLKTYWGDLVSPFHLFVPSSTYLTLILQTRKSIPLNINQRLAQLNSSHTVLLCLLGQQWKFNYQSLFHAQITGNLAHSPEHGMCPLSAGWNNNSVIHFSFIYSDVFHQIWDAWTCKQNTRENIKLPRREKAVPSASRKCMVLFFPL